MIDVTQQTIKLETEEKILSACISSPTEVVFLLSNSTVFRYNITTKKEDALFSVATAMKYTDGGFDIDSPSTLYTLDNIVVLSNDYRFHTLVHYPGKYQGLRLQREDYYSEISKFPIALFKNDENIPHLVYGAAWNHVQIMNLDTRQVLTASKSLIEENAEEEHIEYYKAHNEEEGCDDVWPSPYDYFYGELSMSPDNKHFLAEGWVWGSADSYNVYDVEHFISSHKIKDKHISFWEHENRASCWVSNHCIAVAYNPVTEGDDDATKDTPFEIHLYHIAEEVTLKEKLIIPCLDLSKVTFRFSDKYQYIVAFSAELGVNMIDLKGKVLFENTALKIDSYYPEFDLAIKSEDDCFTIIQFDQ